MSAKRVIPDPTIEMSWPNHTIENPSIPEGRRFGWLITGDTSIRRVTVVCNIQGLVVSRADEFPSGVEAARDRLESEVSLLTHCTCYGVTPCEGSQLVYFAGLEPVDGEEVSSLGFAAMMMKGGEYARATLFDRPDHTDKIGEIFSELVRGFQERPGWPDD